MRPNNFVLLPSPFFVLISGTTIPTWRKFEQLIFFICLVLDRKDLKNLCRLFQHGVSFPLCIIVQDCVTYCTMFIFMGYYSGDISFSVACRVSIIKGYKPFLFWKQYYLFLNSLCILLVYYCVFHSPTALTKFVNTRNSQ